MSTNSLRAQIAHKSESGSFAASPASVQSGCTLPRNHNQWLSIAEFLDAQFLDGFGLRRVKASGQRSEAAAADFTQACQTVSKRIAA